MYTSTTTQYTGYVSYLYSPARRVLCSTHALQVISEMTGGGGVDCSFECIGVPSVMAEAFRSTKKVRRRQTDYTSMLR